MPGANKGPSARLEATPFAATAARLRMMFAPKRDVRCEDLLRAVDRPRAAPSLD